MKITVWNKTLDCSRVFDILHPTYDDDDDDDDDDDTL